MQVRGIIVRRLERSGESCGTTAMGAESRSLPTEVDGVRGPYAVDERADSGAGLDEALRRQCAERPLHGDGADLMFGDQCARGRELRTGWGGGDPRSQGCREPDATAIVGHESTG